MKQPLISVITGIYNCSGTLPEAVEAIQKQTVEDWELILCDDGSQDNTFEVASSLAAGEPRIVLLRNEVNLGLNKTLNRCLAIAQGMYIARMDGDDVCPPQRFEKELALYAEHPEAAVVSCAMEVYDEYGVFGVVSHMDAPQPNDLLSRSQFCHAGSMMRRDILLEVGGYSEREDTLRVEDYDLWVRMYMRGYRGFNTQEILYSMRDDRNAFARRKLRYRINESKVILRAGKEFRCGGVTYVRALVPILKGLCPAFIYKAVHRGRLSQ